MRYIYITAGHSNIKGKDNGAVTKYGNEGIEARIFVTELAKVLFKKYGVMTITESDPYSLPQTIEFLERAKDSEYTIDVHFNAFNEVSTGVEVFVPKNHNPNELSLAKQIAESISNTLSIPLRGGSTTGVKGVKVENESQHSKLGILSSNLLASSNNLLIELCFISNPKDMESYRDNFALLIHNLALIINSKVI